jgi:histidinol phosphatase-like enzyme
MSRIDHAIHVKTIFCDIDGCIFFHPGKLAIATQKPVVLPGVKDKFCEWIRKGYTIILTTGRPESLRLITEQQLNEVDLHYHNLIMNLPRGQRVVINDVKLDRKGKTAACVNLKRNEGMTDVNI